AVIIEADAAGDQIRVEIRLARGVNKLGQIPTNKWFASGKTNLQHAECRGVANDPLPLVGSEFGFLCCSVRCPQCSGWLPSAGSAEDSGRYSRLWTIRTMRWAHVRQFGRPCG